MHFLKDNFEDK